MSETIEQWNNVIETEILRYAQDDKTFDERYFQLYNFTNFSPRLK